MHMTFFKFSNWTFTSFDRSLFGIFLERKSCERGGDHQIKQRSLFQKGQLGLFFWLWELTTYLSCPRLAKNWRARCRSLTMLMFMFFVFDRKVRPNFAGSIFWQKVTFIMLISNHRDETGTYPIPQYIWGGTIPRNNSMYVNNSMNST